MKHQQNNKDPSHRDIAEKVTQEIELIWQTASLPIVSHERVLAMLKTYHEKYRNILKSYQKNKRSDNELYQGKLLLFKDNANQLFDICTCKCNNECSCKKSRKVPEKENVFLIDQRSSRCMVIGKIDNDETKQLRQCHARQEECKQQINPIKHDNIEMDGTSVDERNELECSGSSSSSDEFALPVKHRKKEKEVKSNENVFTSASDGL